jgi:CheY-like chemotaxis protein
MPLPAAIDPPLAIPQDHLSALPLRGLTILAVEDSRFASDALRLICQRTGARLRRAETLLAAHAHLRTYRPDVAVIDLGLPDGNGVGLIAELAMSPHRPEAILATSGDVAGREAALDAGADGFMEKPLESIAAFCRHLGAVMPLRGLSGALLRDETLQPDPLALHDDLERAAQLLTRQAPPGRYVAGFVRGLAGQMHDLDLAEAARAARLGTPDGFTTLRGLIEGHLTLPPPAFIRRDG